MTTKAKRYIFGTFTPKWYILLYLLFFDGPPTETLLTVRNFASTLTYSTNQCWESYFGNVIGYRLQVTLFKM